MADEPKKRVSLPVVGQPRRAIDDVADPGAPTAKAPAAWILLGAMATFAVMMPLVYVVAATLGAIYRAPIGAPQTVLPTAILSGVTVALSSFAGGYLVGRFGGRAGPREGALAGLLTGLVLWALSRLLLGGVLVVLTVPAAYFGARFGRRSRKPGDSIGA